MKNMRLLLLCLSVFLIQNAYASTWRDLWVTQNQQGAQLLVQGKPAQAAQRFTDINWQGVATYRTGDYQKALVKFSGGKTSRSFYNKGNALAQLGQYQKAIDAYDRALQIDPHNNDAKYNKELLKKLLKQQKQSRSESAKKKRLKQNKSNSSKKNSVGEQKNILDFIFCPN